jgi:hypothetical protein
MQIDTVLEYAPARILWALLYAYQFADSTIKSAIEIFSRLAKAYSAVFRPNYYIFFEGSPQPHSFYAVNYWASGSAAPELMYSVDKKLFFPWIPRNPITLSEGMDFDAVFVEERYKALPFLSIEIVDAEGRAAYDLTDFLESMRYVALDGFPAPTLAHVISAWTLSSAIVPDPARYTVRYIDVDGNIHPLEGETAPAAAPVSATEESKESETQTDAAEDKSQTSTSAVISGGEAATEPAPNAAET